MIQLRAQIVYLQLVHQLFCIPSGDRPSTDLFRVVETQLALLDRLHASDRAEQFRTGSNPSKQLGAEVPRMYP